MAVNSTFCSMLRLYNRQFLSLTKFSSSIHSGCQSSQDRLGWSQRPGVMAPFLARFVTTGPPKKPPSAFISFANEKRENILMDNPGVAFKDVAKIAGSMWRALTEDEKQAYLSAASREYAAWKPQLVRFLETEAGKQYAADRDRAKRAKRNRKLAKERLSENMPRRPLTAYAVYIAQALQSRRGAAPTGQGVKDSFKEFAAKWKLLSDFDKQPFYEESLRRRADYETAMLEWEERMVEAGKGHLIRAGSKPKPRQQRRKRVVSTKSAKSSPKAEGKKQPASGKTKGSSKQPGKGKGRGATDENPSWMREE